MKVSFHKITNYAVFFVFLLLLISGPSAAQAENNAWVLDEVQYGTNEYTEWVQDFYPYYLKGTITIGESQLKRTQYYSYTTMNGEKLVYEDVEFKFDYSTLPARLIPGKRVGGLVVGSSKGDPYPNYSSEAFLSYVDTWNNSGDKLQPLSNIWVELDQENRTRYGVIAFNVPDVIDDQFIKIQVRLKYGAQFHLNSIYKPGTVTLKDERLVITNTGSGEVLANGDPLQQGESQEIDESNSVTLAENARVTLNSDCLEGLLNWLAIMYSDRVRVPGMGLLLISVLVLSEDPSICAEGVLKTAAGTTGANHLSLELLSGAGRFETARSDLEINIETKTATVNSVSQNEFAVGHNPDEDVTIAACYRGSVTVDPANTALSGVTLGPGQQVEVTSNSIGPVAHISTPSDYDEDGDVDGMDLGEYAKRIQQGTATLTMEVFALTFGGNAILVH